MSVSSKKIFHLLPLVKQLRLPSLVKQIENSTLAISHSHIPKTRKNTIFAYVLNLYVDK